MFRHQCKILRHYTGFYFSKENPKVMLISRNKDTAVQTREIQTKTFRSNLGCWMPQCLGIAYDNLQRGFETQQSTYILKIRLL